MSKRTLGSVLSLALILSLAPAVAPPAVAAPVDLTGYVDPLIGTDDTQLLTGHSPGSGTVGQGTPAAHVPFGMLQWGPGTDSVQSNARHYDYSDGKLTGFSLHNVFGYEPVMASFLPYAGDVTASPGTNWSNYWQTYSHENETAKAGAYEVTTDAGVSAKLAATKRAGVAEFQWPTGRTNSLIVTMQDPTGNTNGQGNNIWSELGGTSIAGSVGHVGAQYTKGDSTLWWWADFSRPIASWKTFKGATFGADNNYRGGGNVGTVLTFADSVEPLTVRVGVSWVNHDGARGNLSAELGGDGYRSVADRASEEWRALLARFAVTDATALDADKRNFYSAIYRAASAPQLYSDADGKYVDWDGATATAPAGHARYSGWTSWNGARVGQMAWLATFFPSVANDVAASIVDSAKLDTFNHNVSQGHGYWDGDSGDYAQLPELYAFGARDWDTATGLNMLLNSAREPEGSPARYCTSTYLARGYTPAVTCPLAAELTQSYAGFDFATGRLAAALGEDAWASESLLRSGYWRNTFDQGAGSAQGSGYMWGRLADGTWQDDFAPDKGDWTSGDRYNPNTFWEEVSSAQSSFWPTHDVAALIAGMGGKEAFVKRLDDFFTKLNDGTHSRFYYQGNEPDNAAPWLYNWAGKPSGTQEVIRRILTGVFLDTPQGLPGNDDWSAESTWQAWAMLGIFPTVPAVGGFAVTSPMFAEITLTSEDGRAVTTIKAPGTERAKPYIQSATLDGRGYSSPWVEFGDLFGGTHELAFTVGASATDWGTSPSVNQPPSFPAPALPVASEKKTDAPKAAVVDLGVTRRMSGFSVSGATAAGYVIEVSETGVEGRWTPLIDAKGATLDAAEWFATPTDARYARLVLKDSGDAVPTVTVLGVVPPTDLAAGRPVTESQEGDSCGSSNTAQAAIDSTVNTKWCRNGRGSAVWMMVDLEGEREINRFIVKHSGASSLPNDTDSDDTADYKIQASDSASGPWTDLVTVTGNTARSTYSATPTTTARYVRLLISDGTPKSSDNIVRIPSFEVYGPEEPVERNVAEGATTTGSGEPCAPSEGPDKAVDGSAATKWCLNAFDNPAWMTLDLGAEQTVSRFVLKHAGFGGESAGYNTASYRIEAGKSADGPWTELVKADGNSANVTRHAITPVQTRFLRLSITDGDGTADANIVRLYEFEAFGPVAEPDSADARLALLTGSAGEMAPGFDPGRSEYTVNVGYRTETYAVAATPRQVGATVMYNKSASPEIALAVGDNTITVVVTAQDGLTSQTYTLHVVRTVDRVPLRAALDAARALIQAEYTTSTWAALANAVAAGDRTYAVADPTQDDLDIAAEKVLAAAAALQGRGDTGRLKALVSVGNALLAGGGLTEVSAAEVAIAIAAAQSVIAAGNDRTPEQLDSATSALLSVLSQVKTEGPRPPVPAPPAVRPMPVKVKLAVASVTVARGRSYRPAAGVYFDTVHPSYSGALRWTSSNPKIAKVRSDGKITGLKAGRCVMTATTKLRGATGRAISATLAVIVVKKQPRQKVTKVSANVPKQLRVGQAVYVTASYRSVRAATPAIGYSTTTYGIATIDKAGRLVGLKKGTDWVVIRVGRKVAKYKVTVR